MIKHTLEISQRPARIFLRQQQMVIHLDEEERQFACEDIGVLVLQNPAISLTSALLNALLKAGAVVVICDEKHLPSGLLLPTITHTELVPRMMTQISANQPARKQAWKAIVQAKILAQAREVPPPAKKRLEVLAREVKSGDTENHEAQAAKIYWPAMFPDRYQAEDKRDPLRATLFNALLNYGYAIMRAATARALVSAGLLPALGVYHHRRDNPFCLADDLMEPLRPLVDRTVRHILNDPALAHSVTLEKPHRQPLLALLAHEVQFDRSTGPLMAVLPRYIASFYRLLTQEDSHLTVPVY